MQDAVTLANWINTLDTWAVYTLDPVFKEYRNERYPIVKGEFETSQGFTSILGKVAMYFYGSICKMSKTGHHVF